MMVKEYIRIVKGKQPKILVLENVPQLLSCGEGSFLNEIINELSEYEITYKVLNSSAYGVAQERKRAIIIGSKIGKIEHPINSLHIYKTVKQAFEGLNDSIPNQLDYSISKAATIERMEYVTQGGNWRDIPLELRTKGTHSDLYKRIELNKPSITISNPRKSVMIHPTENRILSVRECARIQSFPDDFIFYGTLSDKQQQIANAVPPQLGFVIAEALVKHIESLHIDNNNLLHIN